MHEDYDSSPISLLKERPEFRRIQVPAFVVSQQANTVEVKFVKRPYHLPGGFIAKRKGNIGITHKSLGIALACDGAGRRRMFGGVGNGPVGAGVVRRAGGGVDAKRRMFGGGWAGWAWPATPRLGRGWHGGAWCSARRTGANECLVREGGAWRALACAGANECLVGRAVAWSSLACRALAGDGEQWSVMQRRRMFGWVGLGEAWAGVQR